jgi:hypothetical protein
MRQLKQTTTGRIYNFSKTLAKRSDMVPWPPITKETGLAEPGEGGVKLIEIEYDRKKYLVADGSVDAFNRLVAEHSDLKVANSKLAEQIHKTPRYVDENMQPITRDSVEGDHPDTTEAETEQSEEAPADVNRMDSIVAAIGMLVESGDKNHFAANKMPKIQAIQEVTEFDITGKERDEAWGLFNKK